MALHRVRSEAEWPAEIRDSAVEEFDGELEVRKPAQQGAYDPIAGTYGASTPGAIVLSRRPARAQQIRLPEEMNDGNGWQPKRRYRFQCDILSGDASVTKGLVAHFFGGRDPEVAEMVFSVTWATNSSHAAVRTIEATTEGSRG